MNVCVGEAEAFSSYNCPVPRVLDFLKPRASQSHASKGAIYKFLSGHQVTLVRSSQLYSHAPHKFEM